MQLGLICARLGLGQVESVFWGRGGILLKHFLTVLLLLSQLSTLANADVIRLQADESTPRDLDTAKAMLARGDLAGCRKFLAAGAKGDPDNAHPDVVLASLLLSVGEISKSKRVLHTFALDAGNQFEAHFAYARLAVANGRWFDALAHTQAAKNSKLPTRWSTEYRHATQVELERLVALIALERGDLNEARRLYEHLARNDPSDLATLNGLGVAAFHTHDFKIATAAFKRMADISSDSEPYQLRMASLFRAVGDAAKAEEWYRAAIQSGRSQAVCRIAFADWLISQNRPEDGGRLLTVGEYGRDEVNLRDFHIGRSKRMLGRYAEAATIFSRLTRNEPNNVQYSNQLALALIESHDEAKRARAMQIAAANASNSPNADTLSTLAWIQFRLGDALLAEKTLNPVLASGNVSRDTAHFLAEIKRGLGQQAEADRIAQLVAAASGPTFYRSGTSAENLNAK